MALAAASHSAERSEHRRRAVVLGEPAAAEPAEEKTQCLRGVIDADGRAPGMRRGDARDERRQQRLQDVERDEEREQGERVGHDGAREDEAGLHHDEQGDGGEQHRLVPVAPVRIKDRRRHDGEGNQHDRQVKAPVRGQRQAGLDEQGREHHEHGHLRDVQHEDAEIEPQQLGLKHVVRACPGRPRHRRGRLRHERLDHADGDNAKRTGQHEEARHTDPAVKRRGGHQRKREGKADHATDHRHHLGAMLDPREVGRERHHDRGDRAGALQRAAGDRGPDVACSRGEEASRCEHDEPDVDHGLAAPAVGGHAERNLQQRLRKAVGAERDPDEREVVAAGKLRRVHREHRKNEEEAQHAQAEDAGEARAGAQFGRAHAFWGH